MESIPLKPKKLHRNQDTAFFAKIFVDLIHLSHRRYRCNAHATAVVYNLYKGLAGVFTMSFISVAPASTAFSMSSLTTDGALHHLTGGDLVCNVIWSELDDTGHLCLLLLKRNQRYGNFAGWGRHDRLQ